MSTPNTVNTRHTLTGLVQRMTPGQVRPFKDYLEIVADDAKPYEPGMFKPGKVGEFDNSQPPTQSVEEAQAAYDAVLADNAPQSKVAKAAKADLEAAIASSEAEVAEAEQLVDNPEAAAAAEADSEGDPQ